MKLIFDTKEMDKALKAIVIDIRNNIKQNTRKGIDMNGVKFKGYSKAYAAYKLERTGRNSPVNLMLMGKMMRSISYSKIKAGYELFFGDAESAEIAYYHHVGHGVPQRQFFGINQRRENEIYNKRMNPDKIARFGK